MSIETIVDAAELPEKVRGNIDPAHKVRVTVEDLGTAEDRARRAATLLATLDVLDGGQESGPSLEEAVARVRALRDEWD